MYDWDDSAEICGNCRFWQLGGYQHSWPGCAPQGNAGTHMNGDAGECRRRSPFGITSPSPAANGLWPHTAKTDFCGEFERRAKTFRYQHAPHTDITGVPLST
jgi:hypothetical protein